MISHGVAFAKVLMILLQSFLIKVYFNFKNLPKLVAYADDVNCMASSTESIRHIFKEYERFGKASNLLLSADKTEVLDRREANLEIKYRGEKLIIRGQREVKINGVVFQVNKQDMMQINNLNLMDKITKNWQSRGL